MADGRLWPFAFGNATIIATLASGAATTRRAPRHGAYLTEYVDPFNSGRKKPRRGAPTWSGGFDVQGKARVWLQVARDGQFRMFFFSREEMRIHVHVEHPDGEAKFWLTPDVALATYTGLSKRQLREAEAVVVAHLKEIQDAWSRHFGS